MYIAHSISETTTKSCKHAKQALKRSLSLNLSQKKKDDLLHIAEEIKNRMKADEVVTVHLIDSIEDWRHLCDELEIQAELKRLQEEMVRRNSQKHLEVGEHHDGKSAEVNPKQRYNKNERDTKTG